MAAIYPIPTTLRRQQEAVRDAERRAAKARDAGDHATADAWLRTADLARARVAYFSR